MNNAVVSHSPRDEQTDAAPAIQREDHPQVMIPAQMVELALKNGTVEHLDKLLALQERWEANEARKAFVVAMNAFKRKKPDIHKNKHVSFPSKGGKTEYDHATLDNICDILGEALSIVGLSYRWRTENLPDGWILVTCILTHELGHSEETHLQGPSDHSGGKNAIQAIGSTTEYLRRYTLLAATGVAVKGMDDDGAGAAKGPDPRVQEAAEQRKASAPDQSQSQPGAINDGQRNALQGAIDKAGTSAEKFCKAAKIESLAHLPTSRFKGAMQHLNAIAASKGAAQ